MKEARTTVHLTRYFSPSKVCSAHYPFVILELPQKTLTGDSRSRVDHRKEKILSSRIFIVIKSQTCREASISSLSHGEAQRGDHHRYISSRDCLSSCWCGSSAPAKNGAQWSPILGLRKFTSHDQLLAASPIPIKSYGPIPYSHYRAFEDLAEDNAVTDLTELVRFPEGKLPEIPGSCDGLVCLAVDE